MELLARDLELRRQPKTDEQNAMTRFSRLKTPRASLSTAALLAAYMFAFYMVSALGHGDAALATNAPAETLESLPATAGAAEQSDSPPRRLLPCELRLSASTHDHPEERR